MVENDTAGALEKAAVILVMRQIHQPGYTKPTGLEFLDDISAAFGPSTRSQHRVQHHGSVMMKRYPVVRENRIWCLKVLVIFKNDDVHTRISQSACQKIEFNPCTALDFFAAGFRSFSLKHE